MSIQDFSKEVRRITEGTRLSPAQEEVRKFAMEIYYGIKGGATQKWAEQASRMIIQSIAPDISPSELTEAAASIEGVAVTVLTELFDSGTLIKKEVIDKK